MIGRTAVALLACLVAGVPARADDAGLRDIKGLEGEWRAVEAETNGGRSTGSEVKNLRMVFKGDAITIRSADGSGRPRLKKFKVDPGTSPKAIDITSLDGQEIGQTAACIYSLEKGRLRICMPYAPTKDPGDRPTEFKTRAGDGLMLIVLERVKPE
jgi:uncharacterized protein (TIGR03067 family)